MPPLFQATPIPYLQYRGLSQYPELFHATFTRRGGRSLPPFEDLNLSFAVGDAQNLVADNLTLVRQVACADHLLVMHQTHGENIFVTHSASPPTHWETPHADACMTDLPGLALMVKQADCQGVILFDPDRKVIACVHCGWRGSVCNFLGQVVTRMAQEFHIRAKNLRAAIGPSLGPCCAEYVGHERLFPRHFESFMIRPDYFDFWAISRHQLLEAGVLPDHIETASICTRCRTDLFYSYRGEGVTGRFGTVAMLRRPGDASTGNKPETIDPFTSVPSAPP